MSYSIAIKRGDEYLHLPEPQTEGGTIALGGSDIAEKIEFFKIFQLERLEEIDKIVERLSF